jgi:hypothetical protein
MAQEQRRAILLPALSLTGSERPPSPPWVAPTVARRRPSSRAAAFFFFRCAHQVQPHTADEVGQRS